MARRELAPWTRATRAATHPAPSLRAAARRPELGVAVAVAALVASGLALRAPAARAEDGSTGYRLPPEAITAIVDAPPTPSVTVSPDRKTLLLATGRSLPPSPSSRGPSSASRA